MGIKSPRERRNDGPDRSRGPCPFCRAGFLQQNTSGSDEDETFAVIYFPPSTVRVCSRPSFLTIFTRFLGPRDKTWM
jgi:hypothetical protein